MQTANPRAFLRDHYQRMIAWTVVAGVAWILGAADHDHRLAWWTLAAGIDLLGTVTAHPLTGGCGFKSRLSDPALDVGAGTLPRPVWTVSSVHFRVKVARRPAGTSSASGRMTTVSALATVMS